MPRQEEIEKQLKIHYRRLAVLEHQQAKFGPLHVPAHVLLEIEDVEQKIAELELERKTLAAEEADEQPASVSKAEAPTQSRRMKISRDMWYGLPDRTYLEFVSRYILQQPSNPPQLATIDPFNLDPPESIMEEVYVIRDHVEAEIGRTLTQIILGPAGCGKTTLYRRLPTLLDGQSLVVQIPLNQINFAELGPGIMTGAQSLLTAKLLLDSIFETYWRFLFLDPVKFNKFFPLLRQNLWWRSHFHWFYHQSSPKPPSIPGQFELMGWLTCVPSKKPDGLIERPDELLQTLINLVTLTVQQGFAATAAEPFTQIQIMIDDTDRLSAKAVKRLISDAQRFYQPFRSQLQFKIFANLAFLPQLESIDPVRRGQVMIYQLPAWTRPELRRMLSARLQAFLPGDYLDHDNSEGFEWGTLIPETHLERAAQVRLVEIIVRTALLSRGKQQNKPYLAPPVHVLRLARALVAACAGCWTTEGFGPPLTRDDIETLAQIYWSPGGDTL